MKAILLSTLPVLFIFSSCIQEMKPITNRADYDSYLSFQKTDGYSLEADMNFWSERLIQMPTDESSKIKLAGLHASKFRKTGKVEELQHSDSIYHHLLRTNLSAKTGLYLGLAQNSITQHQFRRARAYTDSALQEGGRKAAVLLVRADIALELGDYHHAKNILNQFTNKNSFAHRIRQVKVKDHEGDLDSAILIMEAALNRIKGNRELYCWSLSNLGDMYGHAGRIEDAYRAYLEVLQKDPGYDYALKGIAWIALSHDRNFSEAKRIIGILASRSRMPEEHLMLAEIADVEKNQLEKVNQLTSFVNLTDNPGYKTMYAKYLAEIYAGDLQKPEVSLAIAEDEIKSRPTPQSFDLKAWALLQAGKKKEALSIAQKYVLGKTFEPDVAYHLGMIYLANGLEDEAEKQLEQALESSFELGPTVSGNIRQTLERL
jgi:tetratricopeptide (TPR) repeat protein